MSVSHNELSKTQMSQGTAMRVTGKCTYHGESSNIIVCELVSERGRKSVVVDEKLSEGLEGIVSPRLSGSGDNRDHHSAAGVGTERGTTSGGALFDDVSVALASGMSSSCAVVSTLSVRVFDDKNRGVSKVHRGVGILSTEPSEGNEDKEDRGDTEMPPTSSGRCRGVEA